MTQVVENKNEQLKLYQAWDVETRVFHWVNFLCVLGLIAIGLIILNSKALGISGDAKILLKTIHVYIGYIFVLNLVVRIVWGFYGNKFVRWKEVLPYGKVYWSSFAIYVKNITKKSRPEYLGHNPIARLIVSIFFVLLILEGITGLILAGTDLYMPPLGHEIAEWVTGSGEDHSKLEGLEPGSKENVDPEAYAQMRKFRAPIVTLHLFVFYSLLVVILLHILGVVTGELTEKSGLTSAMFTGKKLFSKEPVDLDHQTKP